MEYIMKKRRLGAPKSVSFTTQKPMAIAVCEQIKKEFPDVQGGTALESDLVHNEGRLVRQLFQQHTEIRLITKRESSRRSYQKNKKKTEDSKLELEVLKDRVAALEKSQLTFRN